MKSIYKTILLNLVSFSSLCLLWLLINLIFYDLSNFDITPPLVLAVILLSGPLSIFLALPFIYPDWSTMLEIPLLPICTLLGSFTLVRIGEEISFSKKVKVMCYSSFFLITIAIIWYAYVLIVADIE